MSKPLKSLSIFFPAYNDAGTIPSLVINAFLTAEKIAEKYEVIVVNDCSPDNLSEILSHMQTLYPYLRVITHEKNQGYGGALISGFKAAQYEWIFYTDGDAQYDVKELPRLADLAGNADIVNGYKIKRCDPLHRIIVGKIYHWVVKIAFHLKIRDVDCDFRLIRKSVFNTVTLHQKSGVICAEMMRKFHMHGFRILEAPVTHYFRLHGKSQFFNFPRVIRSLLALARIWIPLVLFHNMKRR